jgi:HEAT repeat protein
MSVPEGDGPEVRGGDGEEAKGAGAPMPFTRLGGGGPSEGDWWKWVLDLDPFAPATVPTGPGLAREGEGPSAPGDPDLRRAASAGHRGNGAGAEELASHADPQVRVAALGSLERLGLLDPPRLVEALADPNPSVRRRACELAATRPEPDLVPMLSDDPAVAEMAAWALGERGDPAVVGALSTMAAEHSDALCREAAVAALGAIGHLDGLAAILAATSDRPAVRRRAVIALAPFEGPEVDAALARALEDRDWQVRQAAEDLLAED